MAVLLAEDSSRVTTAPAKSLVLGADIQHRLSASLELCGAVARHHTLPKHESRAKANALAPEVERIIFSSKNLKVN